MTPALLLAAFALGADAKPVTVTVSGLKADAPAGWKAEKPSNNFRSFQFKLPGDDKTYADAELYVSNDADAKVEKNFTTWKGQYTPPDCKKPEEAIRTSEFEQGGRKFHVLDATGTWKFKPNPFDPRSKEETRPEYRTVWVIVAWKDGDKPDNSHIRLSGPKGVVDKHHPEFEKWLKALK